MSKNYKRTKKVNTNDKVDDSVERSTGNSRARSEKTSTKYKSGNDISWYAKNAQLLSDVGNLSFSDNLSFGLSDYSGPIPYGGSKRVPTPGLMTLYMVPSLGKANTAEDAVTVASRSIYAFMRHANASTSKYDASDVMMYLLAMDNAYMYYSWMVRAYGVARTFNYKNRYYPRTVLKAMGLNGNDIVRNLNDFRAYINYFGVQLSSYSVPTNLPYFARHLWLYSKLFLDRDGNKAQTIMFNPEGFFTYDELSGPGQLKFNYILGEGKYGAEISNFDSSSLLTVEQLIAMGNDMIGKITASEDIGYLSADILKAYGADKIYAFASIPEDYAIVPQFDLEIATQFHNAKVPYGNGAHVSNITQDANGVIHQRIRVERFNEELNVYTAKAEDQTVILNLPYETPTPADVMYATRLTSIWDAAEVDGIVPYYYSECITSGSEVVTHAVINSMRISNGSGNILTDAVIFGTDMYSLSTSSEYEVSADDYRAISALSTFDWAPIVTHTEVRYDPSTKEIRSTEVPELIGDLQNYTTVHFDKLDRLHDAAIVSEFALPYSLYMA